MIHRLVDCLLFYSGNRYNQLNAILFAIIQHFNPFLQCISESYIKIKINLNFDFHTFLWCLKRFYETFWDTTKKCGNKNLSFFSSPGIGTWTVKNTMEISNFDSNAMVKMYGSVRQSLSEVYQDEIEVFFPSAITNKSF